MREIPHRTDRDPCLPHGDDFRPGRQHDLHSQTESKMNRTAIVCEAPGAAPSRCGWNCDHSRAPIIQVFVQKQVQDRRHISNKTTLTLTLSRPTGYLFSAMVGMVRRAVLARVVAGGTDIRKTMAIEGVAPLHAARTSQRDV